MAPPKGFEKLEYLTGFGNTFSVEALPNALPFGHNTPQICKYSLYAEQLNGTAFTAPRAANQRSWLYRIQPSARHEPYSEEKSDLQFAPTVKTPPDQMRWDPLDMPSKDSRKNFIDGIVRVAESGDPSAKAGIAIYLYAANDSMVNKAFYNSDGDMLVVPQAGTHYVKTEFGLMVVKPGEIFVIQRGIRFSVLVDEEEEGIRGYICEVYGGHFKIPDLGPIGANGLANPQDFLTPKPYFEDEKVEYTVSTKFLNDLYQFSQDHSCYDVVAWKGNYVPYKYDLALFNTVNSVSYDHLDPSIFTVLTCQTLEPGVAAADFVIFPPRWMVAEKTFRPPFYHRNVMSEYMGLIRGGYDAKTGGGFVPGGGSLHSIMTAHGPDKDAFEKNSKAELKPVKYPESDLAFMFETTFMLKCTEWSLKGEKRQKDYNKVWDGLKSYFDGSEEGLLKKEL